MVTTQSDKDFVKSIVPRFTPETKTKLIYRLGEEDKFDLKDYQKKVHGKGATVVLVKSGVGWVAGGFTKVPWAKADNVLKSDDEAVLFSVTHKNKYPVKQ